MIFNSIGPDFSACLFSGKGIICMTSVKPDIFPPEFRISHQASLFFRIGSVTADLFPGRSERAFSGFRVPVNDRNAGTGQNVAFRRDVDPLTAGHASHFGDDHRSREETRSVFFSGNVIFMFFKKSPERLMILFRKNAFRSVKPAACRHDLIKRQLMNAQIRSQ